MKTKMNRIYALLLTVFMIVGVLTASAFAEAEIPEENTIPEEEKIKDPLVVTSNAIDLSTIVLPPQEEEKPEEDSTGIKNCEPGQPEQYRRTGDS